MIIKFMRNFKVNISRNVQTMYKGLKTHPKIHDDFLLRNKYGSTDIVFELYIFHWIALQRAHIVLLFV